MKRKSNIIFAICLFALPAFSPVPGMAASKPADLTPVILDKTYIATYDEVWEATMAVIKEIQGEARFADKESRLIFFSLIGSPDKQRYYFNIYLEPIPQTKSVIIYFIAHTWDGRSITKIESQFFEKLGRALKENTDEQQ